MIADLSHNAILYEGPRHFFQISLTKVFNKFLQIFFCVCLIFFAHQEKAQSEIKHIRRRRIVKLGENGQFRLKLGALGEEAE